MDMTVTKSYSHTWDGKIRHTLFLIQIDSIAIYFRVDLERMTVTIGYSHSNRVERKRWRRKGMSNVHTITLREVLIFLLFIHSVQ